jgi:hypothetical protein
MAKKTKKTDALAIPVDSQAIIVKTRDVAALTKPENLKELMRLQWVSAEAVKFFKTVKTGRTKLLEAAAFNLRAELQVGAVLQNMVRGSDVTDTTYEDLLNQNMIRPTQANRWRDMGYTMAKRLKLKSLIDESLKFTPAFFEKFEAYVQDCSVDPSGIAFPDFNGFVNFIHETNDAKEKRYKIQALTTFCRNMSFLEAEAIYERMRVSTHLDVAYPENMFKNATEAFDVLVWKEILDKRNLFFGQATEMNRRDKEKANAV